MRKSVKFISIFSTLALLITSLSLAFAFNKKEDKKEITSGEPYNIEYEIPNGGGVTKIILS